MATQGYKNLIKISLFADDSFQPLLKKSDDYRKITQVSIDHFQMIVKNYQNFQVSVTKHLKDYEQQIEECQLNLPQYYYQYIQLYRNIHSEHKSLSQKCSNNFKELTSLCNSIFSNYSNLILNFQTIIRSYKAHQQILMELSKKYFRTHKNMINYMEEYKNSFTDVKLIYNMQEKNKRYMACEVTYKCLLEELDIIEEKLGQLNEEKVHIISAYKQIQRQFKITIKSIGVKQISICKSFVYDFCHMQKIMITYLAEKKFTLQKIELKPFLSSETKIKDDEYFNIALDRRRCQYCPSIIVYHKQLKEEYYPQIGKILNIFLKEIQQKIEKRKYLNKKILDFTNNYIKGYEKCYYAVLKDIYSNFQKIKKKLQQIYGKRLCSFLKSNNSIFEISIGINQKFLKRIPPKLKTIEGLIIEQTKMLDLFMKQFKSNIDNFLKKKQIKKLIDNEKQDQFTQQQHATVDINNFKLQLSQKSQYLQILINGFVDKFKKNQDNIKFQYNALVNDYSITINQFYSLTCQYKELYFGEQDFASNFKKYQLDIDKTLEQQSKFFQQINFGVLIQDSSQKIIFQSQINKIQQFKKIKKPIQIQIQKPEELNTKQQSLKNVVKQDNLIDNIKENISMFEPEKRQGESKRTISQVSNVSNLSQKKESKEKNIQKYEEFLMSKIAFLPDETFFNSYSCGLSDKIILTGRIYITNKRICFHSKFNPKNVFFGDTFMQIPKKDIQKIQKRSNAIIFDNSISITTINGQVFLTSFFSRNEAYQTICNALQINNDQFIFQPQQLKQQQIKQPQIIKQEQDDMKIEQIQERKENIQKMLTTFNYKQLYKCQFNFNNLNAIKYFRMFQDCMEFSFNRKSHKSFVWYFKGIMEHKEIQIGEWTPNISQFYNSGNIKDKTPQKFTRKMTCLVPIPPSGIPFMPKHTKTQQNQTTYVISKDKIIIQSIIQNSGVPYSDCFNLRMKKIIQTTSQNSCSLSVYFFVNFVSTTMMKNMIQSRSFQQSKDVFGKYEKEVKRYLKYLQKIKQKSKEQTKNSSQIQQQNSQQQIDETIEQQQNQKQFKMTKQIKQLQIKLNQGKKILLASLVLNILLILLLIA